MSDIGWEVYPRGMRIALEKFSRIGVPLFVTENGVATDNEPLRTEFILLHPESLSEALERGVNVIGYLYWSLMDDFEWAMGKEPHFGLAASDPRTGERHPRPCNEIFNRVCRENRLAID